MVLTDRSIQIIGGLHLAGPELMPRIPPTINFLSQSLSPAPTYVLPMHCSGFAVKCALEEAFGEGCVPAGVGIKISIESTEAEILQDERLIGSFRATAPDSASHELSL